jgi:hypothetical protein
MRWRRSLLTKEHQRSLQGGRHVNKQSTVWQHPSYLRESLPLNVLHALLQRDHLGRQCVDHLAVFFVIVLKDLDLLGLLLSLSDEIVDHVGQLFNLDLLCVNVAIQLVNHPPYTIRRVTDEIDMLLQTIDGMVLLTVNCPNLVVQNVDLSEPLNGRR